MEPFGMPGRRVYLSAAFRLTYASLRLFTLPGSWRPHAVARAPRVAERNRREPCRRRRLWNLIADVALGNERDQLLERRLDEWGRAGSGLAAVRDAAGAERRAHGHDRRERLGRRRRIERSGREWVRALPIRGRLGQQLQREREPLR